MLKEYYKDREKRRELGLPPLPLKAEQVQAVADMFESGEGSDELLTLLENEIPPLLDRADYGQPLQLFAFFQCRNQVH